MIVKELKEFLAVIGDDIPIRYVSEKPNNPYKTAFEIDDVYLIDSDDSRVHASVYLIGL